MPDTVRARGRKPQSAGLYHRPSLGRAGVEPGGRGYLRLRAACRKRIATRFCMLTNPRDPAPFRSGMGRRSQTHGRPVPATARSLGGRPGLCGAAGAPAPGQSEFAGWWNKHDIRGATAGQKLMSHPKKGVLQRGSDARGRAGRCRDSPRGRWVSATRRRATDLASPTPSMQGAPCSWGCQVPWQTCCHERGHQFTRSSAS